MELRVFSIVSCHLEQNRHYRLLSRIEKRQLFRRFPRSDPTPSAAHEIGWSMKPLEYRIAEGDTLVVMYYYAPEEGRTQSDQ